MSEPEGTCVDEAKVTEAREFLARGKKLFWLREFEEALSCLGQACSIYADNYGETSYECAEPFLLYGKALLEVARLEGDVFGDGLTMDEDDEDDSGDDKEHRTVANVQCLLEGDEMTEEPQPVSMERDGKVTCEESVHFETADVESIDEETENFENITTLHLAWEMIECARIIFLKNAQSSEINLKVAETYLQLGLIAVESETYDQAVDDLLTCLKIREKNFASSRLIAEAHFSLGVAHCLNRNIEASKQAYLRCLDVLQNTNEALGKNKGESVGQQSEEEELQSIVQEVEDRIRELDDAKSESYCIARKLMVETFLKVSEKCTDNSDISVLVQKKENINADGASTSVSSEKQTFEKASCSNDSNSKLACDITHLIRRKRKADEEVESRFVKSQEDDDTIPSKVLKTE